jgi:S-adenosyl-L-methionine hydrolase (adenosine-forming)
MTSKPPVFGLLTDFGFDFAVASMKALILKALPQAHIIDIDHSLNKFSVLSAAFILDKTHQFFPKNTHFITVVDPGVGSHRAPVCIETDSYSFFGPNNGVFHYITEYPMQSISY